MKRLRRGDISSSVSSNYYSRGKRYFEQGRVVELHIVEEDDSFHMQFHENGGCCCSPSSPKCWASSNRA